MNRVLQLCLGSIVLNWLCNFTVFKQPVRLENSRRVCGQLLTEVKSPLNEVLSATRQSEMAHDFSYHNEYLDCLF